MNATTLSLTGPTEVAKALAARAKAHRLLRGWTQNTLAQRAGVTAASYRRFERSGKASLGLVLKVAHALARLDDFDRLLQLPPARSIAELEQQTAGPTRKRGRR
jgi:transcriptional regulator with XRE-family HTH domain